MGIPINVCNQVGLTIQLPSMENTSNELRGRLMKRHHEEYLVVYDDGSEFTSIYNTIDPSTSHFKGSLLQLHGASEGATILCMKITYSNTFTVPLNR